MSAAAIQNKLIQPLHQRARLADPFESAAGLQIPSTAKTLEGFCEWVQSDSFPEGLRATYYRGEIFLEMSRQEIETHVAVQDEIVTGLKNLNRSLKLGKIYGEGLRVTNKSANLSSEPDVTFISDKTIQAKRVKFIPREGKQGQFTELRGTPNVVVEVVSLSSTNKDTRYLREAYHRAGILEYWLIDARGEEIDFQILHWRKSGYVAAANRAGWRYSRVFEHEFQLVREHDKWDMWEYTLNYRPR